MHLRSKLSPKIWSFFVPAWFIHATSEVNWGGRLHARQGVEYLGDKMRWVYTRGKIWG